MTSRDRIIAVPAALALALAASSAMVLPAAAENAPQKQETAIDRTATGSIARAENRVCDPASARGDIVCRITGGDPAVSLPSAPVNPPFGF